MEDAFLGTMTLYKGNLLAALIDRPVAAVIFGAAILVLVVSVSKNILQYIKSKGREKE